MKKKSGTLISFYILLLTSLVITSYSCDSGSSSSNTVSLSTFRIIDSFPHDTDAFTQGLVLEDDCFLEGTGLNGQSSLRQVELETGEVLKILNLDRRFFGEGITIFEDKIVQLTLSSRTAFVYDKSSFEQITTFSYDTEGWGITFDGKNLIMSDGSATLHFIDTETFTVFNSIEVFAEGGPRLRLNELEFVEGEIYANVFPTDMIARISPETGRVLGWIDLTGLFDMRVSGNDVTNGIAYDKENKRLFVTGKRWPELFQIELIPQN